MTAIQVMSPTELDVKMHRIWTMQKDFNDQVKQHVTKDDTEWAQTYLIGLTSEIGEVLRELDWKVHAPSIVPGDNLSLALELADLSKYVLCLWQQFGFSQTEMLEYILEKSEMLEFFYQPEKQDLKRVILADLDGTLADWRGGFLGWLFTNGHREFQPDFDPRRTLSLDVDMGISYSRYRQYKETFERSGGYFNLPPYRDALRLLADRDADVALVVATARPIRIGRIRHDTFYWLKLHGFQPDAIFFTADDRVQYAQELVAKGSKVLMLDDDPTIAARAASNGINVLVRRQPYNQHMAGKAFAHVCDEFDLYIRQHPELMP